MLNLNISVNTLTNISTPQPDNMEHGPNYSFYLRKQNVSGNVAPRLYCNIIASATRKIEIWDPYVHESDMAIFANLNYPVDITILTLFSNQQRTNRFTSLERSLKQNVPTEFLTNTSFRLAFVDKSRHRSDATGEWQFHDRFLIIDDEEYYIIGSSITYHLTAKQSTGIMRVEHDGDKSIIRDAFNETYNMAVRDNCVICLQNLL